MGGCAGSGGLVMNVDPWLKLAEIIPEAILTRLGGNWWEGWLCWQGRAGYERGPMAEVG